MTGAFIPRCQCPHCQAAGDHPDKEVHALINLIFSRLDEQQRRWFAALESHRIGRGGDVLVSQITGLHPQTIRRGRHELAAALADRPVDRVRQSGAGRPPRTAQRDQDEGQTAK